MQSVSTSPGGRPTVITEDVLSKLKAVLQRGISVKKACQHAKIGEKTFYRNYKENEEFRQLIDDWKNFATVIAGEVVVDSIVKGKDVNTAKWWLERKDPTEFNSQVQISQLNIQNNYNNYQFFTDAEFKEKITELGIDKIPVEEIMEALKKED